MHVLPFHAPATGVFDALRAASPLVHCLTNQVVANFTANVLLAAGCAPAMVVAQEEVSEFAAIASALLVNVGTLDRPQRDAMRLAVDTANAAATPWVLDPVAVGALTFRSAFCRELLTASPCAIRGNAAEILALAGAAGQGRGVDSLQASDTALDAACTLSAASGAVVIVTGATDYLCQGDRVVAITGGSPRLQLTTGTGCALSALLAAACALPGERLDNLAVVCAALKRAGEIAAERSAGPGSFAVALLDAIGGLDGRALQARWPA